MGVKELREAFQEVIAPIGTCMKAFLDYRRPGGKEVQVLIFSGIYLDGTGFVIESEPIQPSGDLAAASRRTGLALLNRTREP